MIIFFDGVCNLCNDFVSWLIEHDSQRLLRYASLQSETALATLSENHRQNVRSIVVQTKEGSFYIESQAIIVILKALPAPYKFLGFTLHIIPSFFLNWIYRFISRKRYQLFGQRQTCRMPSEEEKSLFLP